MEEEQNVNPQVQSQAPTSERKGFNISSMVLGIISIVTLCIWYASLPSSILAIIFSVAGRKDAGRGMGIAGMVLGIIALALYVIILVLGIIGISVLGDAISNSYMYY